MYVCVCVCAFGGFVPICSVAIFYFFSSSLLCSFCFPVSLNYTHTHTHTHTQTHTNTQHTIQHGHGEVDGVHGNFMQHIRDKSGFTMQAWTIPEFMHQLRTYSKKHSPIVTNYCAVWDLEKKYEKHYHDLSGFGPAKDDLFYNSLHVFQVRAVYEEGVRKVECRWKMHLLCDTWHSKLPFEDSPLELQISPPARIPPYLALKRWNIARARTKVFKALNPVFKPDCNTAERGLWWRKWFLHVPGTIDDVLTPNSFHNEDVPVYREVLQPSKPPPRSDARLRAPDYNRNPLRRKRKAKRDHTAKPAAAAASSSSAHDGEGDDDKDEHGVEEEERSDSSESQSSDFVANDVDFDPEASLCFVLLMMMIMFHSEMLLLLM